MAKKLTNVYYTVICFVRLSVCDHIHVSRWISQWQRRTRKIAAGQIYFRKLLQTFETLEHYLHFVYVCIYFKRFFQANLDGFCQHVTSSTHH